MTLDEDTAYEERRQRQDDDAAEAAHHADGLSRQQETEEQTR